MTVHARQFTTAGRTQPWWFAALNWMVAPLSAGRFDANVWIDRVVDEIGDEPEPEVREAFGVLVRALDSDARLGRIGRTAAREDCARKLSQHLLARSRVRDGQVQPTSSMPDPIYVLGWMRSGTTALHRMLAADPEHWSPRHYETMFCCVPAGADDRPARTQAVLDELGRISPHFQAIHPMQPTNPEECVNLFTHVFRTPQFAVQYRVPSYLDWLARQDPDVAYQQYAQELGILRFARGGGQRMVLKDPTHMGFLPSILRLFPRARFVFIHRDPVEVFSSMSSMYAYTRAIFSRAVDPASIGPELFSAPLLEAHEQGLACCDALESGRVAHVRHIDFRANPVGEVRRVYETLGLPWGEGTERAFQAHVDAPKVRHRHEHRPEAFGLVPRRVRERLRAYVDRFDLEPTPTAH